MTETTTQTAATPAGTRVYHWVFTLQWSGPEGTKSATVAGIAGVPIGAQRASAFSDLLANARRQVGSDDAVVMFFSLEPNEL